MKTILAAIPRLNLFAGAASASTFTPGAANNATADRCAPPYYSHCDCQPDPVCEHAQKWLGQLAKSLSEGVAVHRSARAEKMNPRHAVG